MYTVLSHEDVAGIIIPGKCLKAHQILSLQACVGLQSNWNLLIPPSRVFGLEGPRVLLDR